MTSTKRPAPDVLVHENDPAPPTKRICLSLGGEEEEEEEKKRAAETSAVADCFGARCVIAQAPRPHGVYSPARSAEILRPWFWFEHTHAAIVSLFESVLKSNAIPSAPFPGFIDTGADPTRRPSPVFICAQRAPGKEEENAASSDTIDGWVVRPSKVSVKRTLWFYPTDKLRLFTCISRALATHSASIPHSMLWASFLHDYSGVPSVNASPTERAVSRVCILPALAALQRDALSSSPDALKEPELVGFVTASRTAWYAATQPVVHAAVIFALAEFAFKQDVNMGTLSGWVELFGSYVCRQKFPALPTDSPACALVKQMFDLLAPLFAQLHDFLFHAGHTAYASRTLEPCVFLLHHLRGFTAFWSKHQETQRPRVVGYAPRSFFTLGQSEGDDLLLLSGYAHSYKRVCDMRQTDPDAGWSLICDATLAEFSHVMVSCRIAHLLPYESIVIAQISRTHHGVEQPCLLLFCSRFRVRMLCLYSRMLGDYTIADDGKDVKMPAADSKTELHEQSTRAWRAAICSGICLAPVYSDIISVFIEHCREMKGWQFGELLRAMMWWAGLSASELATEKTGVGLSQAHRAAIEHTVQRMCSTFERVAECPDIPAHCFYLLAACASPQTRVFVPANEAHPFTPDQSTKGDVMLDFEAAERIVKRAMGEPQQMSSTCKRFARQATRLDDSRDDDTRAVSSTAAWTQSHVTLSGFPQSQDLWEKHKCFATLAVGLDALAHGVSPTKARELNCHAAQVALTHSVYTARFRGGVMKCTDYAFFPRIDNGDTVLCEQFALWMARLKAITAAVDADLR